MKTYLQLIAMAIFLFACGSNSNDHENHTPSTKQETGTAAAENIQTLKPAFTNLDGAVSGHIKDLFDHYIHVKTALVNSNPAEAKSGAEAILQAIKGFDKSLLPAEQKQAYDKSIGGIKASANNIASASDLEKQREHFATLSHQAYELAKSFGAGKTLYHEHCPMALNDKGALWLSESREIKNPYFGEKMMECGTVEEVIQN